MIERHRTLTPDAVLGPDHPLVQVGRTIAAVRRQAVVCTAFLVGIALATWPHPGRGAWLMGSAAIVNLGLLGLIAALHDERRRRARDVIIRHGPVPSVPEVAAAARRLSTIEHRRQLARRLSDALDSAERWTTISPASRPPPTIRTLLVHRHAALSVIDQLQHDHVAVRGVALVERLLDGGYSSPLYRGDARRLGEELHRAAFELRQEP
jgi:hypothetical protein